MVRILSTNIGLSHFYSHPSEQIVSDVDIQEHPDQAFDVFKPNNVATPPAAKVLGLDDGDDSNGDDDVVIDEFAQDFTPQQETIREQPVWDIPNNFATGYRSFTLTITPVDMKISGGSLFDFKSNSNPALAFSDIVDGTTIPNNTTFNVQRQYPSQPLALVLDMDQLWVEKQNDWDMSAVCYHYLRGQPFNLKIAWGQSSLYSGLDDFYQRLYVQLPANVENSAVTVRCQLPRPVDNIRFGSSRIRSYLQSGTVVELHALDLYNKYAQTSYTSVMQRNKAILDSQSSTTPLEQFSFPEKLLKDNNLALINAGAFGYKEFKREQAFENKNRNMTAPVEMITINNVSFVLDYGLGVNYPELQRFINQARAAGLGDFVLEVPHLNRFPITNDHTIGSLHVVAFNDAIIAPKTRDSNAFTLYLRGEIKTATVNMYDHLTKMFAKVLFMNENLKSQYPTYTELDFQNAIQLISVQPYYGLEPYQIELFPDRLDLDSSELLKTRQAVNLNGMDTFYDQTYIPSRTAVTVAWVASPKPNSFSSATRVTSLPTSAYFLWDAAVAWNELFKNGETQFEVDNRVSMTIRTSFSTYDQCRFTADYTNPYLPLGQDNNYSPEALPKNERQITCGGKCDLTCPDGYKCKRHLDCFHGNCNADGICGPSSQMNFAMAKVNGVGGIKTMVVILGSMLLVAFGLF